MVSSGGHNGAKKIGGWGSDAMYLLLGTMDGVAVACRKMPVLVDVSTDRTSISTSETKSGSRRICLENRLFSSQDSGGWVRCLKVW